MPRSFVQIEDARALPPQSWGSAALRSDQQGCISVAEAMEAARFGADVLPVLLPYLEQLESKGQSSLTHQQLSRGGGLLGRRKSPVPGSTGPSGAKDGTQQQAQIYKRKQIVITSPRAFFCSSSFQLASGFSALKQCSTGCST